MKLPIIGSFNTTDSINVDSQRTVNWYLEKTSVGRNQAALYPTPGSTVHTIAGSGPIRGSATFDGGLYIISGDGLYEISDSGDATKKGTLNTGGGRVNTASSSTELLLVDGVNGYTFDGTTLSVITDTEYPDSADQVIYVDGYFLVNDPDNEQGLNIDGSFFWSDLRDGTSWTGTNFATAERDPDKLVALSKSQREVWLFGETSTEIWYNSGGDPTFSPINSGYVEWGIVAKDSASRVDQSMMWLSRNEHGQGVVVKADGFTPKPIASPPVSAAISGYDKIDDAFSFVIQWKGHTWYVLTFPSAEATWVYDATEKVWFEWNSWQLGRLRYNTHTLHNGTHYTGCTDTGKVYKLSGDVYLEDNNTIERLRRTSHFFSKDSEKLFYSMVEVELEYGTGGATDGQVMLRWSDDYGHTWSKEYWKPIGKIGEFKKRLRWKRLGSSRDRVFEIRITDAVKPVLVSGYIRATESSRDM